jgi:hypothetical protein
MIMASESAATSKMRRERDSWLLIALADEAGVSSAVTCSTFAFFGAELSALSLCHFRFCFFEKEATERVTGALG